MRRYSRWAAAALTLCLVIGLTAPVAGEKPTGKARPERDLLVTGKVRPHPAAVSARPVGGAVVSELLAAQLAAAEGPVRMLVRLNAQADTRAAALTAMAGLQDSAGRLRVSAGRRRIALREAVVGALRDTAYRTQGEVDRVLRELQKKGAVTSYRSYWIVNGFAVTGTRAAVEALAQLPDISNITPDMQFHLLAGPTGGSAAPRSENTEPTSGEITEGVEWNIQRIGAPGAWALGVDGTGAVVGSIDTGISVVITHTLVS